MLIYLDICCFNRPYDIQSYEIIKFETEAILAIQNAILTEQISLVWSFMLDFENNANPYPDHREAISVKGKRGQARFYLMQLQRMAKIYRQPPPPRKNLPKLT